MIRDLMLYDRPDWGHVINKDEFNVFYQSLHILTIDSEYLEEYGTEADGTNILAAHQDRQREWILEHFKDEILEQIEIWDDIEREMN